MVQVLVRALVPSRNKVKVWVLKSIVAYIGWVCCLFWPLHKEVFLYLLLFPFFSKPKIFKTNMHPLCRCTSILKDVLPLNCHSFILWSKSLDKIRRNTNDQSGSRFMIQNHTDHCTLKEETWAVPLMHHDPSDHKSWHLDSLYNAWCP